MNSYYDCMWFPFLIGLPFISRRSIKEANFVASKKMVSNGEHSVSVATI